MSLTYQCPCGNDLPGNNLNRRYCLECKERRQRENQNRLNHKRASIREFERMKVNLFKSWVIMFEVKR